VLSDQQLDVVDDYRGADDVSVRSALLILAAVVVALFIFCRETFWCCSTVSCHRSQ
jgi:hypothetical protein